MKKTGFVLCLGIILTSTAGIFKIIFPTVPESYQQRTALTEIREELGKFNSSNRPKWVWKSPNEINDFFINLDSGIRVEISINGVLMVFPDGHTIESDHWGSPEFGDGKSYVSPEDEKEYANILQEILQRLKKC